MAQRYRRMYLAAAAAPLSVVRTNKGATMAEVIGAIRDKWLVLGGEAGFFGAALDIERPTFDGVGRAQPFANGGTISWHPTIGAFAVWGLIGVHWKELGRERFGYPLNDESGCPDGVGRFNHFRAVHVAGGPEASIYWTPNTGAHEVHGAIRAMWASRGFERSTVGYPTSDELDAGNGGRRSNFEHGFIAWTRAGGAKFHGPVLID
jgi:uncharacterized protein with LGFP repeats